MPRGHVANMWHQAGVSPGAKRGRRGRSKIGSHVMENLDGAWLIKRRASLVIYIHFVGPRSDAKTTRLLRAWSSN